jgi:hypothetical protein
MHKSHAYLVAVKESEDMYIKNYEVDDVFGIAQVNK